MATNLSSDFYSIHNFVNEIKKQFTDTVNEDTLLLGTFGYQGEVFANAIQNSIVMASEFANESIPTKAKFEKNIISHALGMNIGGIEAIPASMEILLTIVEGDLISQMNHDEFIFDKDSMIFFNDLEFHLDYDISIRRTKLPSGEYTYTAKYIIDVDNPISDITNPHLTPPVKMNVQGITAIFTKCTIRQVEKSAVYKKVLSDNTIDAKTVNFDFDSQMAAFTVDLVEGSKTTHLVPVYEGLNTEKSKYPYFYYTYLDMNTIRIKFDRDSYLPRQNADITINIQTTQGSAGNFTWAEGKYPQFVFDSSRLGYSNLACEIRSINNSSDYGADKKSAEDLKKLIPKESLSRGSITTEADLENFFNMIDNDTARMYIKKYRDNALSRLFYTYLIMKNSSSMIVPTNTIDIVVSEDDFISDVSNKHVFKKGSIIAYDGTVGRIVDSGSIPPEYANSFLYTIPYNLVVSVNPLYTLYNISAMDVKKLLEFTYINDKCLYQYIATNIRWKRAYLTNTNTYNLKIDISQNISDDSNLIKGVDDNIIGCTVKCFIVVYDNTNSPTRWAEGTFNSYTEDESGLNMYTYSFKFTTEDYIDNDNRIKINGLFDVGNTNPSYVHLSANTKAIIHMVSEQGEFGLNGLDSIIPNLDAAVHSLSNSYTIQNGLDFFYDYSEIISSTVIPSIVTGKTTYNIKGVPVIKYNYFTDEDKVKEFTDQLLQRKTYIDYAIPILEDNFGIDFKFFNTYGPSKRFSIDNGVTHLNRVNLTITFKIKLRVNYDPNIIDYIKSNIKSYIEDINTINSIHMSNLVSLITEKYSQYILFFEFVDMNGYGPGEQHIYNLEYGTSNTVPEFLNINTLENNTPDINVIIL